MLTALVCNQDGVSRGVLLTNIISCECTPESLDQFPSHSIVVSGSDRKNVQNINVLDTIKINDSSIGSPPNGVVAWGVILDPEQQIDDQGDHISITLYDIAEQARWTDTGIGWVASTNIGAITSRLGSLRTGWTASFTDTTGLISTAAPAVWNLSSGFVQVTPDGNAVQKVVNTPNFDSFAWTKQMIGGAPGSFSFRAVETNTLRAAGLSKGLNTATFNDLTYGIVLTSVPVTTSGGQTKTAQLIIFEGGVQKAVGSYASGDIFQVYVNSGNVVSYIQNGITIYVSGSAAAYPMVGLAYLANYQSTIDSGIVVGRTTPDQAYWSVHFEKETILGALIQLAKTSFRHLRTARDANGNPLRKFELGSFGETTDLRYTSPDGFASKMSANPHVRVVTSISKKRDGSKLTNRVSPFGAQTGDAQVDLERAWKMLHGSSQIILAGNGTTATYTIPAYQYWVGNFASNASPFPEYDENYPISRKASLDGRFEYYISTALSDIPAGTEMWSKFEDSQFTFPDDTEVNKVVTTRALYVAAKAQLQQDGYIHETVKLSAEGRGRAPRAGSKVRVLYKVEGRDKRGLYTELYVNDNYYVLQVVSKYDSSGRRTDDLTLSKLGRWDDSTASRAAEGERQLSALRMIPSTSVAIMPVFYGPRSIGASGLNTNLDVVVPIDLPPQVSSIQRASLNVEFLALRSHVVTAGVINEGNFTQAYSAYAGTPFSYYVSQSNGQNGLSASPNNGSTDFMSGGVNGQYAGQVLSKWGGTSSGPVIGPNGNYTTGMRLGSNGDKTAGSSKANILPTNVTWSGGAGSTLPATVAVGVAGVTPIDNTWFNWFDNHGHNIPIGKQTDPTGTGGLTGTQGVWFNFSNHTFQTAAASDGTGMATSGPSTKLPRGTDHGHGNSSGHSNADHTSDMSHDHDIGHAHDQGHTNDIDHLQFIDHYHSFPHTHNIDHTHFIDHLHNFQHTHAMKLGVFEVDTDGNSFTPTTIQVWIDNGSGSQVDISPYLYDKNTQSYGPFTQSFAIDDISKFVSYPGRTVKIILKSITQGSGTNVLGLGEVFVHGTWLVEVSGVASVIYAQ